MMMMLMNELALSRHLKPLLEEPREPTVDAFLSFSGFALREELVLPLLLRFIALDGCFKVPLLELSRVFWLTILFSAVSSTRMFAAGEGAPSVFVSACSAAVLSLAVGMRFLLTAISWAYDRFDC